jgi:MFS family permease
MLFKPLRSMESVHVLRHRPFALFFAAQMVEDTSDSIYLLVLPWLVLESGGSGTALGLTGAAAVLPFLLIGPIGGVLVDRLNRAAVMIGSNILRAVALAGLLLLSGTTGLQTWHLMTAAFVLTTADVICFTARGAVTPALVPLEELVAANSVRIGGWQIVNIGGKAMAGFLVFFIGSTSTIMLSIALYIVAITLLFTIRTAVVAPARATPLPVGEGKIAQVITDLAAGAKFIMKHPVLRALAFSGVIINAAQYPLMGLLLAVFFENGLAAGPRAYGLFLSAGSGGVLIAMLIAPRVAKHVGEGRLGGLSLALWGTGLALLAVVGDVWQALVLGALMGFIGGGLVPMSAFSQSAVPDEMRGRVEGNLMAASLALAPLSFIVTGFLIDSVGPRPLYALAGIVVMVSGLALLASRAVRNARLLSLSKGDAAMPEMPAAAGAATAAAPGYTLQDRRLRDTPDTSC